MKFDSFTLFFLELHSYVSISLPTYLIMKIYLVAKRLGMQIFIIDGAVTNLKTTPDNSFWPILALVWTHIHLIHVLDWGKN
jgi:hypothetical protein